MWPGSRIIEIHWLAALSNTKCTQLKQTRHSESVGALYGEMGVCALSRWLLCWGPVAGELPTSKRRRGESRRFTSGFHFDFATFLSISSSEFHGLSFSYTVTILFFILLLGRRLLMSAAASSCTHQTGSDSQIQRLLLGISLFQYDKQGWWNSKFKIILLWNSIMFLGAFG